jgi:hypothetical protein
MSKKAKLSSVEEIREWIQKLREEKQYDSCGG